MYRFRNVSQSRLGEDDDVKQHHGVVRQNFETTRNKDENRSVDKQDSIEITPTDASEEGGKSKCEVGRRSRRNWLEDVFVFIEPHEFLSWIIDRFRYCDSTLQIIGKAWRNILTCEDIDILRISQFAFVISHILQCYVHYFHARRSTFLATRFPISVHTMHNGWPRFISDVLQVIVWGTCLPELGKRVPVRTSMALRSKKRTEVGGEVDTTLVGSEEEEGSVFHSSSDNEGDSSSEKQESITAHHDHDPRHGFRRFGASISRSTVVSKTIDSVVQVLDVSGKPGMERFRRRIKQIAITYRRRIRELYRGNISQKEKERPVETCNALSTVQHVLQKRAGNCVDSENHAGRIDYPVNPSILLINELEAQRMWRLRFGQFLCVSSIVCSLTSRLVENRRHGSRGWNMLHLLFTISFLGGLQVGNQYFFKTNTAYVKLFGFSTVAMLWRDWNGFGPNPLEDVQRKLGGISVAEYGLFFLYAVGLICRLKRLDERYHCIE